MIQNIDPLARDPLARRLSDLAISIPPAGKLIRPERRAEQRSRRLAAWRMPAAATAGLAALAVTVTAAAYPGGLPGLTQAALRAAGISSPAAVMPLSGSGELAGLHVKVVGGYADQLSTVLFVELTNPCTAKDCAVGLEGAPYLVDQLGTRYDITGGEGVGVGAYPIFFEPISAAAAHAGPKLTLHVPVFTAGPRGPLAELVVPISGSLVLNTAHQLPIEPAVNHSRVTYALVGLVASGQYLEVHTRLSGDLNQVIQHYGSGGGFMGGESWPGVFIVGPDGKWQLPVAYLADPRSITENLQDEKRIFSVQAGTYRIVVAISDARNSAPGPAWKTLASWTIQVP